MSRGRPDVPLVVDLDGTFSAATRSSTWRSDWRCAGRSASRVPSSRCAGAGRPSSRTCGCTRVCGWATCGSRRGWASGSTAKPRPVGRPPGDRGAPTVGRRRRPGMAPLHRRDGHLARATLTGSRKAEALVERFGEGGFDYDGNARPDVAVWAHARAAIVCNAPARVTAAARRHRPEAIEIRDSPRWWCRARTPRPSGGGLPGVRVVMALYYVRAVLERPDRRRPAPRGGPRLPRGAGGRRDDPASAGSAPARADRRRRGAPRAPAGAHRQGCCRPRPTRAGRAPGAPRRRGGAGDAAGRGRAAGAAG